MKKKNFLKIILLLGDGLFMYASLFLALVIRNRSFLWNSDGFVYGFSFLYVSWIILIYVLNLYDIRFFRKTMDFFLNLITFSVLAFFIGVTYFYFRPSFGITPKIILVLNILAFDVLFLLWRYSFNLILGAKRIREKVAIVGFHERLDEILPQIEKTYSLEAVFCPQGMDKQEKCLIFSLKPKIVSAISDFKNIITERKITSIIFALDFYENKDLVKEIFFGLPLTLNYIGIDDLYESMTKKVSIDHLDEIWFLEKVSRPEDKFGQVSKRIFDIFLSVVGLFVFIIFLPFVAVAIKIEDKGSVFYSQTRPGKNAEKFVIQKFRTMKECHGASSMVWREKDSSNITRVGRFLRKTHIDELPQAWSILRGDLSFVGPRPEPMKLAEIYEQEIPFYKQRYLVKPGLFGWAQINFPASLSVDEAKDKFEYDLYYIKNRSLLLDLEIILKSIKLFFV
jgi:exopolysaccharide biosynthesis polyprenyl glycosylphosphotransferase